MVAVTFKQVTRQFHGADRPAINKLDLTVADGEFLCLVGPSGCGKSTTLRMLAGLEPVDAGHIFLGQQDCTDMPPAQRDIAMVFQNYALYSNMTVAGNMSFALRNRRVPKAEIAEKVARAAAMLDLTDLLDRKPAQLSGGQRQRVAMGRVIVRQPQVFLMDEPLSNLDAKLRVSTRAQIAALQKELGTTMVYVTHDQIEAMTMGDRVAVLKDGELQQVAPPRELYDEPANSFVAGFIGSPAMNLFTGPDGVVHGIRPEHVHIDPEGPWTGTVTLVEDIGHHSYFYVQVQGVATTTHTRGHMAVLGKSGTAVRPGDVVHLQPERGKTLLFSPETGARIVKGV